MNFDQTEEMEEPLEVRETDIDLIDIAKRMKTNQEMDAANDQKKKGKLSCISTERNLELKTIILSCLLSQENHK